MRDIYSEVTNRLIEALEKGTAPWVQPWSSRTDPVPGVQTEVLLKHFKVATLERIPSNQVGIIMKALEGKKRQAA